MLFVPVSCFHAQTCTELHKTLLTSQHIIIYMYIDLLLYKRNRVALATMGGLTV